MRTFIIIVAFTALGLSSCKKETRPYPKEESRTSQTNHVRYMPLKVGAYWIYQRGNMDTLDQITLSGNNQDSVYVSGDTLINGVLHFILKHSNQGFVCYHGFYNPVSEVYYDTAAQYIIPYRITANQIGDTTRIQPLSMPGYTAYEIPNYFYNLPTAIGVNNGLWFENRCFYPAGTPEYYSRFFGYDAYVENIGLTRCVITFSSGPDMRMVYELVRYGGLD